MKGCGARGDASRVVHLRLRYLVPLVQMTLAIAIIRRTHQWYYPVQKLYVVRDYPDAFDFLLIMNAPASLMRGHHSFLCR
jgi:hypothetical protein